MKGRDYETGRAQFSDEQTGLTVSLPEQLLLYCFMDSRWVGGSRDGRYLLYIRRENEDRRRFPGMLIEKDFDIYLTHAGEDRRISPGVEGKAMTGTVGARWCAGYMVRLELSGKGRYLLLLADLRGGDSDGAFLEALEVVEQMLFAAIDDIPAT